MILNAGHRGWAALMALAAALGALAVAHHARSAPAGPGGGTAPGLILGSVAFALMIFAGLLGARRRFRTRRVGRAAAWLKAHIWLSLLACVLALLHGVFRLGGPMTTTIVFLLVAVTASGVWGLALQNVIPRMLLREVAFETVFEELPRVIDHLRADADARIAALGGIPSGAENTEAVVEGSQPLRAAYRDRVRPFLDPRFDRDSPLASRSTADAFFSQLLPMLPATLHATVRAIAAICEERRQLAFQARLQAWLHGWLLVHVPLSYALLVLVAAHAVVALRY